MHPSSSMVRCLLLYFDRNGNCVVGTVPPKWIIKPREDILLSTTSDTFIDCMAEAFPIPTARWTRKDGRSLPSNVHESRNGSLVISRANKDNEGEYICTVYNGLGKDLSVTVRMRVLGKKGCLKRSRELQGQDAQIFSDEDGS